MKRSRHIAWALLALLAAAQRDGVWAETNSDSMFETYNTNVTLVVTDE